MSWVSWTWLSSKGYGVLSKDPQETEKLRQELIARPIIDQSYVMTPNAPPPEFPVYTRSAYNPDATFVPKCYGLKRFGPPKMIDPEYARAGVPAPGLKFKGQLRPEQQQPVDAAVRACHDPHQTGGLINMQCGGGKTVIALCIACLLGRKTLIIAHKNFLLDQWRERIAQFVPGAKVGLIKAQHFDVEDKDIVLASIQSFSIKDYEPSKIRDFGLMIIDEVHRSATTVFSKALTRFAPRYSLGLSATLERKDGMQDVFKWFIGDVVYSYKERVLDVKVHRLILKSSVEPYSSTPLLPNGSPNSARMINNITSYEWRNNLIINTILSLHVDEPQRNFLILSDRRGHLELLRSRLMEYNSDLTAGLYVGGMKPEELQESAQKKVILATYSFASEGFDVPRLDTLILASPKSSVEQSVGRILRNKSGSPLVIDLCDMFSMFYGMSKKRYKFYKEAKYQIATIYCNDPNDKRLAQ